MINSIHLRCPNCGANLNIALEMSMFACGYCGAQQVVERYGGTVSLRLLTDAISKVQAGTDRTAAELALRRLQEDANEIGWAINNLRSQKLSDLFNTKKHYQRAAIALSLFCFLCLFTRNPGITLTSILLWIGIGYTIYNKHQKSQKSLTEHYEGLLAKQYERAAEVQQHIDRNLHIVNT